MRRTFSQLEGRLCIAWYIVLYSAGLGRYNSLILVNYDILDSCYHHHKVTIFRSGRPRSGWSSVVTQKERWESDIFIELGLTCCWWSRDIDRSCTVPGQASGTDLGTESSAQPGISSSSHGWNWKIPHWMLESRCFSQTLFGNIEATCQVVRCPPPSQIYF